MYRYVKYHCKLRYIMQANGWLIVSVNQKGIAVAFYPYSGVYSEG